MPTISVSHMRALKNIRNSDIRYLREQELPVGPHAPAKAEAKQMRRLCAQTGLSPDEIRERKTYRKQLAEVAAAKGSRPASWAKAVRLRKSLQRKLGLEPWQRALAQAFEVAWQQSEELRCGARPPKVKGLTGAQAFELSLLKV
jgi:hypothetical protein